MYNILLLYFALYILLFVAWNLAKGDILSPSVLMCGSFVVGVTFYLLGYKRLAAEEFSFFTLLIIIFGIAVFTFFEQFAKAVLRSCFLYKNSDDYAAFSCDDIFSFKMQPIYYWLAIGLIVITALIQLRYEISYVGGGNIQSALIKFRNLSNTEGVESNIVTAVLMRIVYGLVPLYIYITFFNLITAKKRESKASIIIFFIVAILGEFMMTLSRGRIFSIAFQIMTAITIAANYGNLFKRIRARQGNRLWMRIALAILLIGIPFFYLGGLFSGKSYQQITAIESVENYFSYGLIRLNHIILNGFEPSEHFGQWSFSGVYSMLSKLGYEYPSYNIFPFYSRYGNTITVFGRWYVDFGIAGVFAMSAIVSFTISFIYYRMRYGRNQWVVIKNGILYVFFVSCILMSSYDDWYRNILTINQIFQIAVLLIIGKYYYLKSVNE